MDHPWSPGRGPRVTCVRGPSARLVAPGGGPALEAYAAGGRADRSRAPYAVASAAARPAVRPEKMQPPRNVPSRER